MTVRTRFAPSPTGYLHIGGARTALFSWLYARRQAGTFVLRIEDTDRERSTQASVQVILDAMEWLGMQCDEGPFYQSQRFDRYSEVTESLLERGKAYYCYCSAKRLEEVRAGQMQAGLKPRYDGHCRSGAVAVEGVTPVIRFASPQSGQVIVNDLVYGRTVFSNEELDDLIIRRSDGTPTYNFTVVVDDIDMQISHVIRGDDHLNNTPRQINIYQALQAPVPEFAHLPMILGADGARLSKRHGAVNVLEYREQGYLPDALLNYLVRLGWSHGDQEIFSRDEMIAVFDLQAVNKAAAKFNPDKLTWLNQQYIKNAEAGQLAGSLEKYLLDEGVDVSTGPALRDIVEIQRDRVKTLREMAEQSLFVYRDFDDFDPGAAKKHLRPVIRDALQQIGEQLDQLGDWRPETIHAVISGVAEARQLKMGKVAQPLRVAVTGGGISPSIDGTVYLLGKEKSVARIARAVNFIDARSASGA